MPEDIVSRVLRLPGYGVYRSEFAEATSTAHLWVRQVDRAPSYTCGGCGIGVKTTHDVKERTVRDLPWGAWRIYLVLEVHRVRCRRCGVKTERLDFLEGKHPYTRRFSAALARDCEDTAVSRVAAKWGLSPQSVRRIDLRALRRWNDERPQRVLKGLAGNSPYVFPGPKGAPMHWAQKSAERVWTRCAIEDGRLHDIRRTVSTGLARLGVIESIIERSLNHTQPGQRLARTYNTYQYIPEKRAALTLWAQHLTAVVGTTLVAPLYAERNGYQGKGSARRLGRSETWSQRKARLAAAGRDLVEEHRKRQRVQRERATVNSAAATASAGVAPSAQLSQEPGPATS